MNSGFKTSKLSPDEVVERLTAAMAAGNFEIRDVSDGVIRFRHGTYLTQSVPLLPKEGMLRIIPGSEGSRVEYEISVRGPIRQWLNFIAIAFCWLIFPLILRNLALAHHPKQLMQNLLQAV